MTYTAGGMAFLVGGERTASHGYAVGIEAVGALTVVGIEHGRAVEVAEAHDDAVIKAYYDGHPVVYGGPFDVALLSLVVVAVEECRSSLRLLLDGTEGTGCHRVHGRSEYSIVVELVVDEHIARTAAVFIGDVGAAQKEAQEEAPQPPKGEREVTKTMTKTMTKIHNDDDGEGAPSIMREKGTDIFFLRHLR